MRQTRHSIAAGELSRSNAMMQRANILLIVALLAAGCGRGPYEDIDKPGRKILYSALGAKVRGLDPMDIGDTTSSAVASQFYECLYQYHYLKRPNELIPCLAQAMPRVSADRLTYTIPIRKDVYFSDDPCFPNGKGRQLNAQDFVYAWKRIADIKNRSKNWWIFAGKIAGLDEFRNYTKTCKSKADVDYSRPVAGLRAPNDFTLQITLNKPWPQVTYLLAHLPTAPMPKEAVDHYGDRLNGVAVGTGAYILKSWKHGSVITVVRNPNYRQVYYPTEGEPTDKENGFLDDAGKLLPLIDGVAFRIIEEDQPLWFTFMRGKIDAAGIPKDFYNQAITPQRRLTPELIQKGLELVIQNNPSTYWFGFNMEDPVVGKNLPLRRAMSCALNRSEYIDVFTNGRGIPAKGMFPAMFKGYDHEFVNPWCEFNLDRARKLMKDAEKIAGGKITLTLSMPGTDTTMRQRGEYFQRSMERIGLTVKFDPTDWPTFQDRVKNKSAQMFTMGWIADYPDGQNFLQLFYGPHESPGPNNFNYKNPKFDEIYRQIEVMNDTPERLKLYRKLERMVADDCPCIFILHGVGFVPYYKYMKNYKPNYYLYGQARYRNIDLELRKKLVGR